MQLLDDTNVDRTQLVCGHCDCYVHAHPIFETDFDCERDTEASENYGDYWRTANGTITPYVSYEGNAAGIDDLLANSTEWAWDDLHDHYLAETAMYDKIIDSWSDQEPDVCTHAIDRWYETPTTPRLKAPYASPSIPKGFREDLGNLATEKKRNVFIEGIEGFSSVQLIDYHITALYQSTLLNVYTGRDGILRLGSLRLTTGPDGTYTATCYNKACSYKNAEGNWVRNSLTLNVPTDDDGNAVLNRKDLEDFILAVIRHGNNHGPTWLTTRSDFTYIHATTCDTQHPQGHPCNHNHKEVVLKELTGESLQETARFLSHHVRLCRAKNCQCGHYLLLLNSELFDRNQGRLMVA